MEEIWKEVDGYEGVYWISNMGNIKTSRKKVTICNNNGYKMVTLVNNHGEYTPCYIHRLVAAAFVAGRSKTKDVVNHLDEDKLNNMADNLEWTTRAENVRYSMLLSKKIADEIRELYSQGIKRKELAEEFGVTPENISHIVNNKIWI